MKLKKMSPSVIGLSQSLGVAIYTILISLFFRLMGKIADAPDGVVGIALMLFLLVFSVAIVGLLVFGYPAYLAINKKVKEALAVLSYTLGFAILIFIIILLFVLYI